MQRSPVHLLTRAGFPVPGNAVTRLTNVRTSREIPSGQERGALNAVGWSKLRLRDLEHALLSERCNLLNLK